MVVLHIFCVLVCFLKQLQNFALGKIYSLLVCSLVNLLLTKYFTKKGNTVLRTRKLISSLRICEVNSPVLIKYFATCEIN